jgi:hypothetical protein
VRLLRVFIGKTPGTGYPQALITTILLPVTLIHGTESAGSGMLVDEHTCTSTDCLAENHDQSKKNI